MFHQFKLKRLLGSRICTLCFYSVREKKGYSGTFNPTLLAVFLTLSAWSTFIPGLYL